MLVEGTLLQGRYRIKRLLAQGGMGAVFAAVDERLKDAPVAVKQMILGVDESDLCAQFEREAALLSRLRHPALPRVSDHFTEAAGQFLVMEFIPGDDLGELLETRGRPFNMRQVVQWADTLLGTLSYIHTWQPPIIHRDIKPQNIKLTPRGEIVLIDFGLAKNATTLSRSGGSVHGFTLAYAPPEQLKHKGTDARSDLYSLGATLYHLLTNDIPVDAGVREQVMRYRAPDPLRPANKSNPRVPAALAELIAKAMTLDAAQRFQSAVEMRRALRAIPLSVNQAGKRRIVIPAQPIVMTPRMRWITAAVMATLLVVGGLYRLLLSQPPPAPVGGNKTVLQPPTPSPTLPATTSPESAGKINSPSRGTKPSPQLRVGGGRNQPTPPSKGVPPQMALTPQIIMPNPEPPKIKNPTLVVPVTIYGDPKLKPPKKWLKGDSKALRKGPLGDPTGVPAPPSSGPGSGDPLYVPAPPSSGPGSGAGIGRGSGTGVGSGEGIGRGIEPMTATLRPTILYKERAKYTEEARTNKIEGTVTLSVEYLANGSIGQIRVVRGLPDGLTESAIEAAKRIRFNPAIRDGRPVSVRSSIQFNFTLY